MKKLFAIAVMVIASLTASAQSPEKGTVSLTPMVGISQGSFFNVKCSTNSGDLPTTSGKIGFTGGVELGYMASNWFKPSLGLMFNNISSNMKADGYKVPLNNNYFAIPVLANFYVANGLALKVGVQPAFLLSSKIDGKDVKEFMNSFDFSIPIGISYEYKNFVVDARIHVGATNIIKDDCSLYVSNGFFEKLTDGYGLLTVGYRIDFK